MIRPAAARDIPQLCGLMSDFYSEMPGHNLRIDPDATRANFEALLASDDVFLHVIDEHGLIRGAACLERIVEPWTQQPVVIDHFVYVTPPMRNRYKAGRLLVDAVDWAKGRPCVIRLQASTGIDGDRAARVFQKLGMTPTGGVLMMENF